MLKKSKICLYVWVFLLVSIFIAWHCVVQVVNRQMLGCCTNNKVGRIRKEAAAVTLRSAYYPSICLEGLRKITKTSVKLHLSDYKAEAVGGQIERTAGKQRRRVYIELLQ
jgi:hypothetical protein